MEWYAIRGPGLFPSPVSVRGRHLWQKSIDVRPIGPNACRKLIPNLPLPNADWQAIILEIVARDWKVFLVAKICAGAAAAFLGTAIVRPTGSI